MAAALWPVKASVPAGWVVVAAADCAPVGAGGVVGVAMTGVLGCQVGVGVTGADDAVMDAELVADGEWMLVAGVLSVGNTGITADDGRVEVADGTVHVVGGSGVLVASGGGVAVGGSKVAVAVAVGEAVGVGGAQILIKAQRRQ